MEQSYKKLFLCCRVEWKKVKKINNNNTAINERKKKKNGVLHN